MLKWDKLSFLMKCDLELNTIDKWIKVSSDIIPFDNFTIKENQEFSIDEYTVISFDDMIQYLQEWPSPRRRIWIKKDI